MLRERITRMPLKDGDVLLIQGRPEDVDRLRGERDVVLMEWSRQPLVTPQHRRVATVIFLAVVAASAFDRSAAHTSDLQSLMRHSNDLFCLKKITANQTAYDLI